jgi:pyruvate dehydrogenase E1 component alpha subunit
MPMEKLFGDFLGNVAGSTGGLGAGIVHIAWPQLGILGQSGTLGGCFPIAAGAGLSAQYRGTDQVTLCFFGDGTANRGTFHEAANAAGVWKLPVVWLCENNGWAVSGSFAETCSAASIADRAAGYGMPGVVVDGQDAVAVYEATRAAVERARRGEGPTLIEAMTIRFRGHFEGDPDTHRDREDMERMKRERDPLTLLAARLKREGMTEAELASLQARIEAEVEQAAELALAAPMPAPERIHDFLYV